MNNINIDLSDDEIFAIQDALETSSDEGRMSVILLNFQRKLLIKITSIHR